MRRFVQEADRGQWTLLPECLDDFIDESNSVRVFENSYVGELSPHSSLGDHAETPRKTMRGFFPKQFGKMLN